ncbi:hypothetical protein ROZALSC1DRAFT_21364, partial [Rozella allomycis CSF55]
ELVNSFTFRLESCIGESILRFSGYNLIHDLDRNNFDEFKKQIYDVLNLSRHSQILISHSNGMVILSDQDLEFAKSIATQKGQHSISLKITECKRKKSSISFVTATASAAAFVGIAGAALIYLIKTKPDTFFGLWNKD